MKREIFFWLEKLSISRGERNTVSVLMAIFLVLVLIRTAIPESVAFDDAYYAELDEALKTRAALIKQKEDKILARYQPQQETITTIAITDTLPEATPQPASKVSDTVSNKKVVKIKKINVNEADAKALETLHGIGPAYAGRIVEYRQENGPFATYEELLKIKGIGKKRLEKLLPFIQLKESTENK